MTVDAAGTRRASGRHSSTLGTDRRAGWDFLMGTDPHFSLALPNFSLTSPGEDRGCLMVRVDEAADGTLALREAPDRDGSTAPRAELS
ncbi:hypothetical protein ACIQF6_25660 [Kitasatospora sp. NPDC092948]|uniref:hypothetical protein n=1 Tax=Kitasatospora sp. NPDC092948 TaxID=3364088 RepID=UPI003818C240